MGIIYSNIPELQGTETEISLANLAGLEIELDNIFERRIAHLSELAKAIIKDGGDIDTVKSIILSIKSDGEVDRDSVISENIKQIGAIFSRISLVERLIIFREVFAGIGVERRDLSRHFTFEAPKIATYDAVDKIAYLRNSYNDVAYMHLSSFLCSPRAEYCSSTVDVCERVFNDKCEYCILPIETSDDGKLLSFYDLIFQYGLKINAIYDLSSDKAGEYTRYALLGKNISLDFSLLRSKNKYNKYFEFILTDSESLSLSDILTGAEFCCLEIVRVDTLTRLASDKKDMYICPVFRINEADMQTFLSFLTVDCPDFIPMGLYIQI